MKKENPSKVIIVPRPPVKDTPDSTSKSMSPVSGEEKEEVPEKAGKTVPAPKDIK
ncbi:MAG: hypothetical protein IJL61_01475 [Bacteroidales bacterium]|nr:hypothetical protein [Bacteroidales bacterium]